MLHKILSFLVSRPESYDDATLKPFTKGDSNPLPLSETQAPQYDLQEGGLAIFRAFFEEDLEPYDERDGPETPLRPLEAPVVPNPKCTPQTLPPVPVPNCDMREGGLAIFYSFFQDDDCHAQNDDSTVSITSSEDTNSLPSPVRSDDSNTTRMFSYQEDTSDFFLNEGMCGNPYCSDPYHTL